MNFKKNVNYFTKSDLMKNLGIGLTALGLFLLVFGWSYVSFILMSVTIPTGLILFLVGISRRTSEKDLDAMIDRATANVAPTPEKSEKLERRAAKKPTSVYAEGYELREGLMLTKAKNGSTRSSEYTKTYLLPLSDALYIISRTISLVEDVKSDRELEIPYSEIASVALEREEKTLSFNKKPFRTRDCRFTVVYHTGERFSVPIQNDILTEQFTEDLQTLIEKHNQI